MSAYEENEETKLVIDAMLYVNRSIQSDLGSDSTTEDKEFARLYWNYAKAKIQKYSPSFWEVIKHQDDED